MCIMFGGPLLCIWFGYAILPSRYILRNRRNFLFTLRSGHFLYGYGRNSS